jgi:hypothetical protein
MLTNKGVAFEVEKHITYGWLAKVGQLEAIFHRQQLNDFLSSCRAPSHISSQCCPIKAERRGSNPTQKAKPLPRRQRFGRVIFFGYARVSGENVYSSTSAQPQEQYTRGLACTGTICGLVGTAAISCTSLLRVASLNCSRSLITMTKDPGPPITQSS